MTYTIYRASNLKTGKVYIGLTSNSVGHRWAQHIYNARGGQSYYLYRAMRKYGLESFLVEAIEEVGTWEEANIAESRWIAIYASLAPKGYNLTAGGDAPGRSPETSKRMGQRQRERFSDPAQREATSKATREAMKEPATQAKLRAPKPTSIESNRKRWLDPEFRARVSRTISIAQLKRYAKARGRL